MPIRIFDSDGKAITVGDYIRLLEPVFKYRSTTVILPAKSVVQVLAIDRDTIRVQDILNSVYEVSSTTSFKRLRSGRVKTHVEVDAASSEGTKQSIYQRCVSRAMVIVSNAAVEEDPVKLARLDIAATLTHMATNSDLDVSRQNKLLTLAQKLI